MQSKLFRIVALLLALSLHGFAGAQDLLQPDVAFKFSAKALDASTLEVRYKIADGYYLYRDKFKFTAEPATVKLGTAQFPQGDVHNDEFFGKVETYRKDLRIRLPFTRDASTNKLKLTVTSQGCADVGVCYVPQQQTADIDLPAASSAPATSSPASGAGGVVNDEARFERLLASGSLWLIAAAFFGAGVGAALSGNLLSAALQNPWVLSAFAMVFVLLSLSMFGFYELQLPSGFHAKITETSNRLKGGHLGAVVLMGIFSAAIVSPCVGVPLILVGVFEGAFLPKSGHWMRSVKHFFGVLLLAVAIWIVAPVLPVAVQMFAWAALLIGSAMVLRAIDSLPPDAGTAARLWKGVGFLALLAGAALAIGAFAGSRDVLRPLAGLTGGGENGAQAARFTRVRNVAELDAKLQAPGRPVMLDFYADWCVSCKEMEAFTFTDARVKAKMGQLLLLQADVTANSAEDKALLKRFSLFGPPGIIFFDRHGREIDGLRVIGYQQADAFLATLDRAAAQ